MPLKLNVGLLRKVGESNFGSRGASVNLELEFESALVGEPERLRERILQLFMLARVSVDEELQGQQGQPAEPPPDVGHRNNGNCNGSDNGHGESNGHAAPRLATDSQVRAIFAIAKRVSGELQDRLSRYRVFRPQDLTINQASELIDSLKAEDAGAGSRR